MGIRSSLCVSQALITFGLKPVDGDGVEQRRSQRWNNKDI